MKKYMITFLLAATLWCSGCASLISRPPQVILLPEERIFSVSAGQEIKVKFDKKEMAMTFPEDMNLVSSTVLVRQEEKLNNEKLKSVKATADRNKTMGIAGSIFAALAAGLGIFVQAKKWFPKTLSANVVVK